MSEPELLVDVLARVLTPEVKLLTPEHVHVLMALWAFEQWGTWFCVFCEQRIDECDCHCRSDA
jgi:predicted double-glycine peptidase